jgi:hypothetical protein
MVARLVVAPMMAVMPLGVVRAMAMMPLRVMHAMAMMPLRVMHAMAMMPLRVMHAMAVMPLGMMRAMAVMPRPVDAPARPLRDRAATRAAADAPVMRSLMAGARACPVRAPACL